MGRLSGKTALITGCNRGIGKEILERFVQEGCNIIACTRNIPDSLIESYHKLESEYGIKITPIAMDLSDEQSVKDGMKSAMAACEVIDILVNNAGVAAGGLALMTSMKTLHDVFQINYFSQVLITQYVEKKMMKQKSGSVINMSSIMGLESFAGGTSYGASKSALAYFTRTLSKELGAYNIRVNAIAPNLTDTEMAKEMEKKAYTSIVENTALKRVGQISEIVNVAVFLASDESSYISGQIMRVDGGL